MERWPTGREASAGVGAPPYVRHRPEQTLLYQLVRDNDPAFKARLAAQGSTLPDYVEQEFEDSLRCGRLEHGFLRVSGASCRAEHLVAFSCKRRGFCPSCGARRMAESAALLVDEVFPEQPVRQWVLSVRYPLRCLFASHPEVIASQVGILCIAFQQALMFQGAADAQRQGLGKPHQLGAGRFLHPAEAQ